jgi:hypothetical protein
MALPIVPKDDAIGAASTQLAALSFPSRPTKEPQGGA